MATLTGNLIGNDQHAERRGHSGPSGGGFSSTNNSMTSTIQNAMQMAQNAVQPAVQAIQAQASPLQQRYKDLIGSLQGQQQTETNRQTVTTNNELARRGVLGNSGLAEQEMTNALNPITSQYSGQIKDAYNQQNIDLAGLASQAAQLQSSAGLQGLSLGNNQYQFGQNFGLAQKNQGLDQQRLASQIAQQKAQQDYQDKIYRTISLPESQASIAKMNAGTGTDTGWQDFLKQYSGGNNTGGQGVTNMDPNKQPLTKNYVGSSGWSPVDQAATTTKSSGSGFGKGILEFLKGAAGGVR